MQKSASGKLQANTRVNVITVLEADKDVFRRTMLASSARLHRRHHLDARQHDAAAVADLGAAVSVGEHRRERPAVRRAELKAKQMPLALRLRPILVVGAVVQDHVVVDQLDIAGLELDVEIV